ncbi:MAG TPA: hypothetical protein VK615_01545, partial [Candidatus Binatia bacterium]|nr:hypothetical protein [Candidatus Binatia bacterium]
PERARWGIIVGGYFANRVMAGIARSNPDLAPWLLPLRILYVVFVVFTWLAYPIFNLMLFLHPVGRHALDEEQRAQATWVGISLGLSAVSLGGWGATGGNFNYLIPALVFGLLAIPTAAVFSCSKGWPRFTMLGITLVLAAAGVIAVAVISFIRPPKESPAGALGAACFGLFLLGTFISQWVANWLAQQRPAR